MSVNSVKPLSLSDLAIKDGVELDRRSVGAIFGVPGFLLGVGSFNREEFNVFVSTVLRPLAQVIEQELTKSCSTRATSTSASTAAASTPTTSKISRTSATRSTSAG